MGRGSPSRLPRPISAKSWVSSSILGRFAPSVRALPSVHRPPKMFISTSPLTKQEEQEAPQPQLSGYTPLLSVARFFTSKLISKHDVDNDDHDEMNCETGTQSSNFIG